MKTLFIGDIVGKPGRLAVRKLAPEIRKRENAAIVIANGENMAGGSGITKKTVEEILSSGVDIVTSGDHIWKKREIIEILKADERILRPLNYPSGAPGSGFTIIDINGIKLAVVNLLGRVFMESVDCPFRAIGNLLEEIRKKTPVIFVDFRAEATSEKIAMFYYLDGKVTAVFGTHTHIQAADEKVSRRGTAYITETGMPGPYDSVLGRRVEDVLERFVTCMPVRFEVAGENIQMHGVIVDFDELTGKALSITRIQERLS